MNEQRKGSIETNLDGDTRRRDRQLKRTTASANREREKETGEQRTGEANGDGRDESREKGQWGMMRDATQAKMKSKAGGRRWAFSNLASNFFLSL